MMEEEADDIVFDSAQLIKKRGADSKRARDRLCHRPEQLRRGRLARTCFIFASFVCLGLSAAVTGPTLPYFMQKVNLDVGKLAYIYTACCFGYMMGAVVGSILFEQFGRDHLLLGGGMAAGALGLALTPFCSSLLMLCCVLAITGLANGFLYSGGIALCCRQWGSRSSSVIEWLYFAVSVGALVAALLCAAFIADPTSAALSVTPKGALLDADASSEVGLPIALPKRQVPTQVSIGNMNRTDMFSSSPPILSLPTSSDRIYPTTAALSASSLVNASATLMDVNAAIESSSSSRSVMSTAESLIPSTATKLKKPGLTNAGILSQNANDADGRGLGNRINIELQNEALHGQLSAAAAAAAAAASVDSTGVRANFTGLSAAAAATVAVTDMQLVSSSTTNFTSSTAALQSGAYNGSTQFVVSDENATYANKSFSSTSRHSDPTDNRTDESAASVATGSQISSTLPFFAVTTSDAAAPLELIATNGTAGSSAVLPSNGTAGSSAVLPSTVARTDEATAQVTVRSVATTASFAVADSNISVSAPPSALTQTDLEDLGSQPNVTVPAVPIDHNVTSPAVETAPAVSSTLSGHWATVAAPVNVGISDSTNGTAAATTSTEQSSLATNDSHYNAAQGNDVTMTFLGAISRAGGQSTSTELPTADNNSFTIATTNKLVPGSPEPLAAVGNVSSTTGSSTATDAGLRSAPTNNVTTNTLFPGSPEPSVAFDNVSSTAGLSTATDAGLRSASPDRHTHSAYIDDIQFVYLIASAVLLLVAVGFMCLSVDDRDSVVQPPTALTMKDSLVAGDDGRSNSMLALHASLQPSSRITTEGGGIKFASRILALAFVVCVLYMGVEVASGQLLATYAMRSAVVPSEHHAALLVAAFWGTFALVRGLSAVTVASSSRQLCRCLSPAVLLVCGLAISCIALIVLSFSGGDGSRQTASATWAGTALLGIGLAPVFPACLAWTQQYMDLGASRIRAALVGGSSLGGMVLPVVAGYILQDFSPNYTVYALLATVAACAAAFALAWYTAVAAHGSRVACCVDGRASYEAVATDALPIDDGFGYPHERTPVAERLHPERNTGHKTVSFRLLDDDSDKDV